MNETDKLLGMNRSISRRDFLQGVALSLAASRRGRAQERSGQSAMAEPPWIHGLRGQDVASTELGHRIRDGKTELTTADPVDTGEEYDLVVVGAGIAGLASAFVYYQEKPGARILLLDNHDDFGGHARRNTFEWEGTTLIGPGGTFALEEPEASPPEAMAILENLGVDIDRLEAYRDRSVLERFQLSQAVFFDPRSYPGARATWVDKFYQIPHDQFFSRAPISDQAKRELVELYTTRRRYLPDVENAEEALAAMTWERFIRDVMGLGDHAVRFANLYATDLVGLGSDAVTALDGYENGPGFYGMGGTGFYEKDGILVYAYEPVHRYPDGNHTIARHLLKKMLPTAVPGPDTMEGVFNSRVNYDQLDRAEHPVRVRLRSLAIRIEHQGPLERAQRVVVSYLQPGGRVHRVTARSVVVAAWGMVAKHIVPELPVEQRRALEDYRYCSAIYINVLLRHWRPIAEIGASEMFWPDGYCTWMQISDPLRVGEYHPDYHPDRPTVLSMYKYIYKPGLPPADQMMLGRYELENKPFEEYEREIRSELNHALGPWGFDAAEDILAITVNRWGHGYNFFPPQPGKTPAYELGRTRLGRISFAGADAGGTPWTQAAMEQAHRAAHEQLALS